MIFNLKRGLLSFLLLGVICMINTYGCAEDFKYERYSGKNPELNFTLDYISGWLYSEQVGSKDSFSQAVFYEPAGKGQASRVGMVVTVEKSQNLEINPLTIDARAEDILTRRLKFKDARVLAKDKKKILGFPAWDIKLSYKTPDKLYSIDAKLLPVKERMIIFKRQDRFYTLRYENKAEEFDKLSRAFDHLVNSLKFKDK
jgi:hypothetical protein